MSKYLDKIMIALAIIAVLVTVYNVAPASWKPGKAGLGSGIVVVDMLRLDVAQKRFIRDVINETPGPQGVASAFRATKDVVAAAKRVAPGKAVAVKQAFLHSDYPDITDEVLVELGLSDYLDSSQKDYQQGSQSDLSAITSPLDVDSETSPAKSTDSVRGENDDRLEAPY